MRRILLAVALIGAACSAEQAAPASCDEAEGVLRTIDVDVEPIAPTGSEVALLWLPACANLDSLQIVMLMHGAGLKPSTWFDDPVDAAAAAEQLDRSAIDTAVLAPGGADGNQFFIDHTLEPLLDAVATDLGIRVPVIGIGGYSAGGPTVARMAFGPDRIAVQRVGLWAPVWAPQYTRWIEADLGTTSIKTVLLDAGADDGLGRSLIEIEQAVVSSGADVAVQLERPPGGHTMAYMASRIDVWLAALAGVGLLDASAPLTD